jgi:hypothetical protein
MRLSVALNIEITTSPFKQHCWFLKRKRRQSERLEVLKRLRGDFLLECGAVGAIKQIGQK